MGSWSQTLLIVELNSRLKTGDVRSGLVVENSFSNCSGIGTGSSKACGLEPKNDCMLPRDKLSAVWFTLPGMCSMRRFML